MLKKGSWGCCSYYFTCNWLNGVYLRDGQEFLLMKKMILLLLCSVFALSGLVANKHKEKRKGMVRSDSDYESGYETPPSTFSQTPPSSPPQKHRRRGMENKKKRKKRKKTSGKKRKTVL